MPKLSLERKINGGFGATLLAQAPMEQKLIEAIKGENGKFKLIQQADLRPEPPQEEITTDPPFLKPSEFIPSHTTMLQWQPFDY